MTHSNKEIDYRDLVSKLSKELNAFRVNYHNLYENSVASIFTFDIIALKSKKVNDVCVQFLGYESKQDFIDNYNPLNHLVDHSVLEKNLEIIKREGELRTRVQEMKKKDGTHIWVKLFAKKLYPENNLVQYVLIDITQYMHYQAELENKVKERTIDLIESIEREKKCVKRNRVSFHSHHMSSAHHYPASLQVFI